MKLLMIKLKAGKAWERSYSPFLPLRYLFQIDMMKQSLSLAKKPHVVVATPGRLADHLRSTDTVSLKKIKFLVR